MIDMNIYNLPLPIAKAIAWWGKFCPKLILNLRHYAHHKEFIKWQNPRNIHEYALAQLFNGQTDLSLYARLADKVAVRDFVQERIGAEYLTSLYGVYETADKIDIAELPEKFVLKTNHGCGNNLIITNKEQFDINKSKALLDYWQKYPYGDLTGQIHYSKIKPLIFAEEFLQQSADANVLPFDYKFFCYKGKPKYILYYERRSVNKHETPNMLFDLNWLPIKEAVLRPTEHQIPKPQSFDKMLECVRKLCVGFDFVRVDFYEICGRPIFGEMTFTPDVLINIKRTFSELMEIHKQ